MHLEQSVLYMCGADLTDYCGKTTFENKIFSGCPSDDLRLLFLSDLQSFLMRNGFTCCLSNRDTAPEKKWGQFEDSESSNKMVMLPYSTMFIQ